MIRHLFVFPLIVGFLFTPCEATEVDKDEYINNITESCDLNGIDRSIKDNNGHIIMEGIMIVPPIQKGLAEASDCKEGYGITIDFKESDVNIMANSSRKLYNEMYYKKSKSGSPNDGFQYVYFIASGIIKEKDAENSKGEWRLFHFSIIDTIKYIGVPY